ncbi:MAG TPA: DinB family protein [Bryobacteraceae bacterium]|nr:DinB family protein [Bryobacteraceae bacterium]
MQALLTDVERSVVGGSWHGPSLTEAIAGLTAAQASARPIPGAHTVWEIVAHAIGWIQEVVHRFAGNMHAEPAQGDWPAPAEPSAEAWTALQNALMAALVALRFELTAFPAERLDEHIAEGRADTFRQNLSGLAQHNAYHAGQIMLLRKLL